MEGGLTILSPVVQAVFAGFCLVLLGVLIWIIKWLFKQWEKLIKERENDFKHIKQRLRELPCKTHTEQLRQMEKRLNS